MKKLEGFTPRKADRVKQHYGAALVPGVEAAPIWERVRCVHGGAVGGRCPRCQPDEYATTLLEQRDKLVKALRGCVAELQQFHAAAMGPAFVKGQVALKGTALLEAERVLREVEK